MAGHADLRGRVGGLIARGASPEKIAEARAALKAAGLEARIREAVSTWPPLTPRTGQTSLSCCCQVMAMPPDSRRGRLRSGLPGDNVDAKSLPMVTEQWFGATLYAANVAPPRDPARGLAEALDHLDDAGLCCCWVTRRRHRGRAA